MLIFCYGRAVEGKVLNPLVGHTCGLWLLSDSVADFCVQWGESEMKRRKIICAHGANAEQAAGEAFGPLVEAACNFIWDRKRLS